jgi:hypothetical protein
MLYRIKLIREVLFELVVDAPSRKEAVAMVLKNALDYDSRDYKSTQLVSVHEENPVRNLHS